LEIPVDSVNINEKELQFKLKSHKRLISRVLKTLSLTQLLQAETNWISSIGRSSEDLKNYMLPLMPFSNIKQQISSFLI
jgi:hypothetical protein